MRRRSAGALPWQRGAAPEGQGNTDRPGIVSPSRLRRTGRESKEQEDAMGRTATAFLVLIAVGGCVADDAGPVGVLPVSKTGQPAAAPSYATWNRTDQFAALQEDASGRPVNTSPAPLPIGRGPVMIAQKPLAMQRPAAAPLAPSDV